MFEQFKNEKFDVIIMAGQSNASGSGLGHAEDAYTPVADVFMLSNPYDAKIAEGAYGNQYLDLSYSDKFNIEQAYEDAKDDTFGAKGCLAYSFSEEYIKNRLKDGRKVLIIKAAIGGTGFSKNHWGVGDELYQRMVKMTKMALDINPENKLVAVLWHQGEHDTFENAQLNDAERFDFYYEKLSTMLKTFRKEFGVVPFIGAGFTKKWYADYKNQSDAVYGATEKVVSENAQCAFLKETFDLQSNHDIFGNNDIVHFCKKGLYELGRRYYKAYENILNK